MEPNKDLYILNKENIQDPPTTIKESFKYLGPGFILSATVVGSGELIATTTLGAKAGFITLWIIIISCLVKVMVQIEVGKHAIYSGETIMTSFNNLKGLKFGKAHWTIWTFLALMITKLLQVGGIIGGVAIILNFAFPDISLFAWCILLAIFVSSLVYKGYYKIIERFSLWMIALFTLFTFISLYFLRFTQYTFTFGDILSGLQFDLPKEALVFAFGAFGITGIGGEEIIYYNYWCLEKGYAAYTGPYEAGKEWLKRAKGWIKIMYLDALFSMIVYTVITAAFYLLGAAVLFKRGEVPQGYAMIETLSSIYTESLGQGAKSVFLFGAAIVLFSTLFSALAAWTRFYSDMFGQIGWINFFNVDQRTKTIAYLAWIFPPLWVILFLYIQLPVIMVISGGLIGSVILVMMVYMAMYFRYYRLLDSLKPTLFYDIMLWISSISIFLLGIYGIWQVMS